jgi:CRISPR-associated exonuclease Cas4
MMDEAEVLTSTDLKQYTYCPRVIYFEACTPGIRPTTYKMKAGNDAHDRERERAARRTFHAYQIVEGERHFDVRLRSTALGLSGLIDEIVITEDEVIVVDYKLSSWTGDNHLVQLAAYAIMAEEVYQRPAHRGFVYLMKTRQFNECPVTPALRNSVIDTIHHIRRIRLYEQMPPPIDNRNKCAGCEFRRFCGDV